MEKLELYHIHKKGDHDKVWHESALIEVNERFKNTMYRRFQDFTTGIPTEDGGKINLWNLIALARMEGMEEEMSKDLIDYAFRIAFNANYFKRESALENYRIDNVKKYPSRLHCIYLTDEKGIDAWIERLAVDNIELFRVEATGNIFKTSEIFIPNETLNYEQTYEESYKYWHPNLKKAPDNANEYLVQGKIKVLEKIK